jgi:hypothetical protein
MEPRRISPGDVIGEVFRLYREHAVVLLVPAVALTALSFLIDALTPEDGGAPPEGAVGVSLLIAGLLTLVVSLVLNTIYQGLVVELVRDVQDGRRDVAVGTMLRGVTPVVGPLILMSVVAGIAIVVGLVLLLVPGLILLTIWAVAAPVIVVERAGAFASLGRSRQLVQGNGFPVFGALILAFLISIGLSFVVGLIAAPLGETAVDVASFIVSVLTAPVAALVAAVLYFALLRARDERPVAAAGDPAAPGLA